MKILQIPYRSFKYKINEIIEIKLDDKDYEKFKDMKFNVVSPLRDSNRQFYFRFRKDGRYHYLHRIIASSEKEELLSNSDYSVDHINRDTLDCRRENLRFINKEDNVRNKVDSKYNTTGARGVCKIGKRYIVQLDVRNVRFTARNFDTIEEASAVYKKLRETFNNIETQ